MNPQDKELLQKSYDLSLENNKILRGIRSSNRWGRFFHFVYWVIIIGVSLGAFYYLQPYVKVLSDAYATIQGDIKNVQALTSKLPNLNGTK